MPQLLQPGVETLWRELRGKPRLIVGFAMPRVLPGAEPAMPPTPLPPAKFNELYKRSTAYMKELRERGEKLPHIQLAHITRERQGDVPEVSEQDRARRAQAA